MNHLTADESMCDNLSGILSPVEIRDEQGKLLGTYTPYVSPELLAAYEKAKSLFDPVETKRRREEQRGEAKPFIDMIRRLESGEFDR